WWWPTTTSTARRSGWTERCGWGRGSGATAAVVRFWPAPAEVVVRGRTRRPDDPGTARGRRGASADPQAVRGGEGERGPEVDGGPGQAGDAQRVRVEPGPAQV